GRAPEAHRRAATAFRSLTNQGVGKSYSTSKPRSRQWPGGSAIAAGASVGVGKRSVDAAVDQLEAAGYLIDCAGGQVPADHRCGRDRSAVDRWTGEDRGVGWMWH